jgi:hypothetical protein
MAKSARVLKRCEKCGKTSRVRTRVQHCYRPGLGKMGLPTGYACWGTLTTVVSAVTPKSSRDDYEAKLHKAHGELTKALTRLRRVAALVVGSVKPEEALEPLPRLKTAMAAVERWRKRVNYYDTKIGKIAAAANERTRRIVVSEEHPS